MRTKHHFSIIEIMTVVLIVLLLISITIPIFVSLKVNAKSAICKNQLRQMGVLITSYASENRLYLPNDDAVNYNFFNNPPTISDLNNISKNTRLIPNEIERDLYGLYAYWNGHLLPYLDIKLPTQYSRNKHVEVVNGKLKVTQSLLGRPATTVPTGDRINDGWAVVEDALDNGGFDSLKLFICPQIHGNTSDLFFSNKNVGLQIPRVSLLFSRAGLINGWGTPTTYLAAGDYFGKNGYNSVKLDSRRIDEIPDISSKLFIIEGGVALTGGGRDYEQVSSPYFYWNTHSNFKGGSLSSHFLSNPPDNIQYQKLNFVHDRYDEFWIMGGKYGYSFPFNTGDKQNLQLEPFKEQIATNFNLAFEGKAMMVKGSSVDDVKINAVSDGYSIVSYSNPYLNGENLAGGTIFDAYFKKNPKVSPLISFNYYDALDFNYLVGNMNVLFGDGSVASKNNAWLSNNRMKTTSDSGTYVRRHN